MVAWVRYGLYQYTRILYWENLVGRLIRCSSACLGYRKCNYPQYMYMLCRTGSTMWSYTLVACSRSILITVLISDDHRVVINNIAQESSGAVNTSRMYEWVV
jgi:hypothetical protein